MMYLKTKHAAETENNFLYVFSLFASLCCKLSI